MKNTITKPTFKEVVGIITIELPDVNLIFNANKIGPAYFKDLRNADYGKGFIMPISSELVPLVYSSLENKEYETAQEVIKTMKDSWLLGNTAVHYFSKGIFAEDNPEIKDGKIITPDCKTLEKKLGKYEERGVVFSDDKSTRFTPYNYQRKSQSALQLSKNTGVIALFNGEENAEKLALASEHYKLNPSFFALSNVNSPETRVVSLYSGRDLDGGRLSVSGDYWGDSDDGFAFGVKAKSRSD